MKGEQLITQLLSGRGGTHTYISRKEREECIVPSKKQKKKKLPIPSQGSGKGFRAFSQTHSYR